MNRYQSTSRDRTAALVVSLILALAVIGAAVYVIMEATAQVREQVEQVQR